KTPVREALRQLVHEGLVDVLPRKGYVVRPVGLVDIVEVLALRRIVEPTLAAAAAGRRTTADVEVLRDLVDREAHMRPSLDELRTSLDVHARVAAIAGNARAAALVDSLLDETARIPWLSPWFSPGSSAGEHGLIVEAIAACDAEAAAQSMATHLEETQTRTLAALGAR
ncbi:MAG: GntR family transcriptional regulator, partial [Actinobacteria bacterium]|nr:GntR family transcriptional regulator [Actinomycetota bacterium]